MKTRFRTFARPSALPCALPLAALALLVSGAAAHAQATHEYRRIAPELLVTEKAVTPAALSLSTNVVDFGNVATHTTTKRQVVASNEGQGGLTWRAAPTVSGDSAFSAGLTSCGASLAPGESCQAEVSFSPVATGSFSGALTFTSALANSPHEVTLVGTAFNPVSLASAALPAATVGQAYSYDFKALLAVSNEASPDKAQASWGTADALPAGLSLDSGTGVLSGAPTQSSKGRQFTVTGTYKNNQGQQVYTLVINGTYLEVVQISAGQDYTCAVTTEGEAKCWGLNGYGQLGDGTATTRTRPVQVSGLTSGVTRIAAGHEHTCAVQNEAVFCWGRNHAGQLGIGSSTATRFTPVQVGGLSAMLSVSASSGFTCATAKDGRAWCWGANNSGYLGIGHTVDRNTPQLLSALPAVSHVETGGMHSCALTRAGAVYCWGRNAEGQVGNGTTTQSTSPFMVWPENTAIAVGTGHLHSCATNTSGNVFCWGHNGYGQLGDGTKVNATSPKAVSALAGAQADVAAGGFMTCSRTAAGAVSCWGETYMGNGGTTGSVTPVALTALPAASAVSIGNGQSCVVLAGGEARCWGSNSTGQVGDGTKTVRTTPVQVLP